MGRLTIAQRMQALQLRVNELKDDAIVRDSDLETIVRDLMDEHTALGSMIGYQDRNDVDNARKRIEERKAQRGLARDKIVGPRNIRSAESRAYGKALQMLHLVQDVHFNPDIARAIELIRDAHALLITQAESMRAAAQIAESSVADEISANDIDPDEYSNYTNGQPTRKLGKRRI